MAMKNGDDKGCDELCTVSAQQANLPAENRTVGESLRRHVHISMARRRAARQESSRIAELSLCQCGLCPRVCGRQEPDNALFMWSRAESSLSFSLVRQRRIELDEPPPGVSVD